MRKRKEGSKKKLKSKGRVEVKKGNQRCETKQNQTGQTTSIANAVKTTDRRQRKKKGRENQLRSKEWSRGERRQKERETDKKEGEAAEAEGGMGGGRIERPGRPMGA